MLILVLGPFHMIAVDSRHNPANIIITKMPRILLECLVEIDLKQTKN